MQKCFKKKFIDAAYEELGTSTQNYNKSKMRLRKTTIWVIFRLELESYPIKHLLKIPLALVCSVTNI